MRELDKRLSWEKITLKLHNPFRLSYGVSVTREAHWLRLIGEEGWGEGTVPPYYGISEKSMIAVWEAAARRTDPFPDDPDEITDWVGNVGPAPARCAIDLALHDRIGRKLGQPLYQILALPKPGPKPTCYTIPIDTPGEMARMAAEAPGYPIIKLKLGSEDDQARVAAVRGARPDVGLYVDANAAWTPEEAVQKVRHLEAYGLDMVEQPVAKDDIEGLGLVQSKVDVPIVADESLQSPMDVDRLAAVGVRGLNLKLMKFGGLGPGLQILQRGRELGMQIMLGCMVETSLGVTTMAHLMGLADWIDLDSPLLISNDPFEGVRYEGAHIHLSERPGIGVVLRDDVLGR
jgi:L-alanine-DL-glutamate epimerase-like enolase superfamily enzyme